jgi:hypothetical protein
MKVPSAVAITLESAAICRLTVTACCTSGELNGCSQLSKVNPCQTMLNFPAGLLKENTITTAIGSRR